MSEARFEVHALHDNGMWTVEVKCQDGSDYAEVTATHLDVALRMAVPYMNYAAQPDPFADLFKGEVQDG